MERVGACGALRREQILRRTPMPSTILGMCVWKTDIKIEIM